MGGPRLFGGIGTLKAPQQPVQTVGSYWPYPTMVFRFRAPRDAVGQAEIADQ